MNQQIEELEERLRIAMLNSDVSELDKLLSENLIFTNHLGQKISKKDDINSHFSKIFVFESIELSEQDVLILEGSIIVSAKAIIMGLYNGQIANGNFRFTRVWSNKAGAWQVQAGHSSIIA